MASDEILNKNEILSAIRKTIGSVCKKNGFAKKGKSYWWRIRDDAIHAIHLDRRVVGKYPYFVEVKFDFMSIGATPGGPLNIMPVGLNIERTMRDQGDFLTALAPEMDFGPIDKRIRFIEQKLQEKITGDIDGVVNLNALEGLRRRYPDRNTLIISLRASQNMSSF